MNTLLQAFVGALTKAGQFNESQLRVEGPSVRLTSFSAKVGTEVEEAGG
jgi:hypothetical protein